MRKVLAIWFLERALLQIAVFLLCPHRVAVRERAGALACSQKDTNPFMRIPSNDLMTSSDPNHLPEAPPPDTIT